MPSHLTPKIFLSVFEFGSAPFVMSGRLQHAVRLPLRPICEPHLISISAFCRVQPPKKRFCRRRHCSFQVPADDFVFSPFNFGSIYLVQTHLCDALSIFQHFVHICTFVNQLCSRLTLKIIGRGFRGFQTLGVWSHVFDASRQVRSSVFAHIALVNQVWTSKENGKLFLMLFA